MFWFCLFGGIPITGARDEGIAEGIEKRRDYILRRKNCAKKTTL